MNLEISDNLAEYARLQSLSRQKLTLIRGSLTGERLWILGTGPSLMLGAISRFEQENVLYLNNSVTLHEEVRPKRAFCVITDHVRLSELRPEVSDRSIITLCSTDKVFNRDVSPTIFGSPLIFLMPKLNRMAGAREFLISIDSHGGFSRDLGSGVFLGKTVLMPSLQVAAYLGASEVVLCGVDMTNARGEYFSSDIRSHWNKFDYEADAKLHLQQCVRELNGMDIVVRREFPSGNVSFLPSLN